VSAADDPSARAREDADALLEHAPCGLLVTDADGTIRRANATFCAWVGRGAADLVDRARLQDLLTVGGRIFHHTHWAPLLDLQGSVSEVKFDCVHADGRVVPMLVNAVRRRGGGTVRDHVAAFVVADRHRYERELLAARRRAETALAEQHRADAARREAETRLRMQAEDRALFAEQMVGIVSHDLRNPLAAIVTGAAVLERGVPPGGERRIAALIASATRRATRLVDDLLDFTEARIGTGLTVRPGPIDLHAAAAACLDELRPAFPDRTLRHEASGAGECTGDADRLAQAVGNLVANAVAHGAAGRPITLESRIGDDAWTLAVHNHGEPIEPALLPRLFEPMTRGRTDGTASDGVGLGLYIVREIARAHGGSVGIESSAAAGTRVTIAVPRARAGEPA